MTHRSTPRRGPSRILTAACLAVSVAALSSCAKQTTAPDSGYTMPEGVVDPVNIEMIVWPDQPTSAYLFHDVPPADPDDGDTLIAAFQFRRYPPGTLQGLILDHTVADGYRMYRREPGGGVRLFSNVQVPRTRRWVATQYEAYHFVDVAPSGYAPPSYVGRGVVEGVTNEASPLTPMVAVPASAIGNIDANAVWYQPAGRIKLRWTPVPGTVRYLLQVYDFRSDLRSLQEAILSGTMSPLYDGLSTDYYVGYVAPDVSFMFVGDLSQPGLTTFMNRPIPYASPVKVRLTALDASGHIIAITQGAANPIEAFANGDMGLARGYDLSLPFENYLLFRLGSTTARDTVSSGRPTGGIG